MQLAPNTELQNGKYRIIRVLGQGGFGITYLAENTFFEREIAIKEFFPKDFCGRDNTSHLTLGTQNNAETVEKLKARFLKEAKNIAKLEDPGIIKIHDIFEENDTAYYVMDYIDGENLNEMVKRCGALPESKAIEYIKKVGSALQYIHSRNMTHFDVKPANIVVRRSDDEPILIDFGLSKQYDKSGDATSTMVQGVSQGYSPMELYNMGSIATFSPQTDVYSLAATLYYLVTGKVPPPASEVYDEGITLPSNVLPSTADTIRSAMVTRSKRPANIDAWLNILLPPQMSKVNTQPESIALKVEATRIVEPKPTPKLEVKVEKSEKRFFNLKELLIMTIAVIVLVTIACIILIYYSNYEDGPSTNHYKDSVSVANVVEEVIYDEPTLVEDMFWNSPLGTASYTGSVTINANGKKIPYGKKGNHSRWQIQRKYL